MQAYTYLLINFFTIIICFIASFDRRIRFNRFFGIFLLSSTIVAIPFILWDVWFTKMGVWWFDTEYTLGIIIAGLPLEEWLFFFCIPFSCVFTYFCLDKFFNFSWAGALNNVIVFLSFILLTVCALLYYERTYTLVTALITLLTVFYLHFIVKSEWIGQATFTYLILMPGFFAVNGILTGSVIESPVVNYNPNEFLGIRMFTIPVEDAVYGYSQFLLNIFFFKLLKNKLIIRD
ncbi:lycopene cyclase domain-containing protein [Elizabethkingia anophelis]|uniref:Lycopene cyclase n=1 Tax=Elizabethkingia anophelis TaxID=1117645 RepID=A0A1T3DJ23_9FLAO|nr:lycopene cyclase domain-containing protein [Elizabethkingia anophelis]AQW96719.1 lycopene cyclase [Elizabethkingia anophelis]AQX52351.1 lycopene cyclase [Elizabethkingia anophelis]AQX90633.1 lycopene cyclase [Elizabethkingia anophelis]ASV79924.1 lycopene cyclase domain-containing protein [Elizabethkingia anophelis]EHM7981785.1 lycopene cyclase domain-containing protein [Elizabethkingia anophelis]